MIRAIIADDEPLARAGLREFLELETDVQVIAECRNGSEAVEVIAAEHPDLILLDVQMPGLNGFEVLTAVGAARPPAVILVTAYDRHALEAFEAHALDFLLKPVEAKRFKTAMERARQWLEGGRRDALIDRITSFLEAQRRPGYRERVLVKAAGRIFFVAVADIRRIEARGNYAKIHGARGAHVVRETLQSLEASLDPRTFIRVHRSHLVNLEHVRQFQTSYKGDLAVILDDGTRLPLSRSYREQLEQRLGKLM